VQVIEFRTVSYPSLLAEMMDLMADEPDVSPGGLPGPPVDQAGLPEVSNLKLAIAKIRKVVQWTEPRPQAQMATPQI
jgi:hypothetical protein